MIGKRCPHPPGCAGRLPLIRARRCAPARGWGRLASARDGSLATSSSDRSPRSTLRRQAVHARTEPRRAGERDPDARRTVAVVLVCVPPSASRVSSLRFVLLAPKHSPHAGASARRATCRAPSAPRALRLPLRRRESPLGARHGSCAWGDTTSRNRTEEARGQKAKRRDPEGPRRLLCRQAERARITVEGVLMPLRYRIEPMELAHVGSGPRRPEKEIVTRPSASFTGPPGPTRSASKRGARSPTDTGRVGLARGSAEDALDASPLEHAHPASADNVTMHRTSSRGSMFEIRSAPPRSPSIGDAPTRPATAGASQVRAFSRSRFLAQRKHLVEHRGLSPPRFPCAALPAW